MVQIICDRCGKPSNGIKYHFPVIEEMCARNSDGRVILKAGARLASCGIDLCKDCAWDAARFLNMPIKIVEEGVDE